MAFKKWVVGSPDREFAKQMAAELDIDPFTALIAGSRGIDDYSELEYFLSNEPLLSSPRDMADISKAADCINEAIDSGLKIAVFGDYDCDGVMATAIMCKYLISRNADVIAYIPDRITEGYGMNKEAVDYLNTQGVKLIITVDNGIACNEEIEYAASLGIVTVVSDHHLPGEVLPDACAVVDPHRSDCLYSFKNICGAQVAFNLICVVDNKEPEELLDNYADLLAVAIIGDFMPMVGENRSVVKYGINLIKRNSNTGLSTILSVAGIDRFSLDSTKISFGIVPRINAAGRIGSAMRAFDLVCENNFSTILSIANEIESDNISRQKTEKEILNEVSSTIELCGYNHDRIIVVNGEGYHPGVIGIVAARICDKYGKPAIVLSSDGTVSHGSGRSVKGFNIFEAIKDSARYLVKFGGHELAAGISILPENIDLFRNSINDYAMKTEPIIPTLNLDLKINPSAMSVDMVEAIRVLEPFGNGNASPLFGIFGAKLEKITPIGHGKHLRLVFSKNGFSFQTVLFGVSSMAFNYEIGDTLDLAVSLDINTYKGESSLSVIVKAIRFNGIDEEALFKQISAFDDYISKDFVIKDMLLPTRQEIGSIYNYIKSKSVTFENVINRFLLNIGYAKTQISVIILKELNLIEDEDGLLSILDSTKTELTNSKTYIKISKAGE